MFSKIVQVQKRGNITLPVIICEKYRLEEGDPVTLIDLGEGIFLSPKRSLLPKLVEEIEHLREKHGVSLEELVAGIAEQRAKYGTDVE
jgi:bifunctional DNA-binding transcriptional regulator/antitoxin component of YhaV-PrlF toxin-antitoxin module